MSTTTYLNTVTGLVIGIGSAATTLSSVVLGRLGDQIGHRRVLMASALVVTLGYLPISVVTGGLQLVLFYGLAGVALGGVIPTISALLARFTHSGDAGAVYGLDNSINAGARAVAPLIGTGVAAWFGLRSSFGVAALFFLVVALLGYWRLPREFSMDERVEFT